MTQRLVVATTNPGKLAELAALLEGLGYRTCGLADVPPVAAPRETGSSFAENAELKARHYAAALGLPVLADDSGLMVTALAGAPGVRSARFAGTGASDADNNALLLQRLAATSDRRARFVCALCLVDGGEVLAAVEGRCEGTILREPRGSAGFGYDSLFVPDAPAAGGKSFAELESAQKAAFSHRGAALRALQQLLADRKSGVVP